MTIFWICVVIFFISNIRSEEFIKCSDRGKRNCSGPKGGSQIAFHNKESIDHLFVKLKQEGTDGENDFRNALSDIGGEINDEKKIVIRKKGYCGRMTVRNIDKYLKENYGYDDISHHFARSLPCIVEECYRTKTKLPISIIRTLVEDGVLFVEFGEKLVYSGATINTAYPNTFSHSDLGDVKEYKIDETKGLECEDDEEYNEL